MIACQTTEHHQTMVLLFQAQVSKTISKTMGKPCQTQDDVSCASMY
jgi:hypothetical protein